jgi:hypothetical protein
MEQVGRVADRAQPVHGPAGEQAACQAMAVHQYQ